MREDIRMKTYMYGPMDYAKKLKVEFRVGDLDLPERRAKESRTHILVGECEIQKEKRNALLEEMRNPDLCDMGELVDLRVARKRSLS